MSLKQLPYLLLVILAFFEGQSLCAQISMAQSSVIYSTSEINAYSDTTALFTIKEILIEGNQKTKDKIILRELPFTLDEQYSLNVLIEKFAKAKEQLMNSSLFLDVIVSLQTLDDYNASVKVQVKERWYIFPIPFAKVVDQELQQWATQSKLDMGKVKYGIKITHKNITGRNDRLTLNLTNGFTKQLAFGYSGLPLDKALKWSSSVSVALGQNRDFQYATVGHKGLSYRDNDNFVHKYFNASVEASYRKAIKTRHTFGIGYTNESLSDTFLNMHHQFQLPKRHMNYPEFYYRFQYYDADFIPYPTRGYVSEMSLSRKGLGGEMNLWQLAARTSASWPLNDKYFFNARLTGIVKLPFKQPFINQRMLIGGTYMQGYEDFQIDGVAGGFTKATLTRKFLQTAIHIPSQRIKKLNTIPIKIYGKVYGNTGYVYAEEKDPTNKLNNRWLYSGGIGLDVVLFYDFVFKLEWSWNHLRQNGVYLHDKRYL
jgi:outer membrane protein assembly factor BamA